MLFFGGCDFPRADFIITNPPWARKQDGTGPLHEMIERFRMIAPTWLLIDADWAFTAQARYFMRYCSKMVVVGRVSWADNGVGGKENCAWYRFGEHEAETIFCT